ncbi:MAG: AMP-binding protein, partial [Alphaproteobacteria bacterium]
MPTPDPFLPGGQSAHIDTFAADNLPPRELWPLMDFSVLPKLAAYPNRINAAGALLDAPVEAGDGDRPLMYFADTVWTYAQMQHRAEQIARVLVEDLGLVAGNRVLLRGPNNPMMAACWFGVIKAGGICVSTMPMLRARELAFMIDKAQVTHALCDASLAAELSQARERSSALRITAHFTALGDATTGVGAATGGIEAELDRLLATKPAGFTNIDTAADDVALIAFTSGTTGQPKGTMHFHRDMLAMCDTFADQVAGTGPDDIFTGTPPLAFTFGLGALLGFPMRSRSSIAFVERPAPDLLLENIQNRRCTVLYTAPIMFRAILDRLDNYDISSLRQCVSAGEHLPKATFEAWYEATGLKIIDGLGSTEMIHIFVSSSGDDTRAGATGKVIPGYQACIMDDHGKVVPPG